MEDTGEIHENTQIKIGIIQMDMDKEIQKNFEKAEEWIAKAASKGAQLVILPELFNSRYFAQTENIDSKSIAETDSGPTSQFIKSMAIKYQIDLHGGSFYEKEYVNQIRYYNTTLVYSAKGEKLAKYRKMHIPYDPLYYEKYYFESGNLGYQIYESNNVQISPLICYDQWFPEPARIVTLQGAQIIIYPTAIGWFETLKNNEPNSRDRWQMVIQSHAAMNSVYTIAANRVGIEGDLTFWGGSLIVDPFGEKIQSLGTEPGLIVAELNTELNQSADDGWGFLRNRRPDSYHELIKNY